MRKKGTKPPGRKLVIYCASALRWFLPDQKSLVTDFIRNRGISRWSHLSQRPRAFVPHKYSQHQGSMRKDFFSLPFRPTGAQRYSHPRGVCAFEWQASPGSGLHASWNLQRTTQTATRRGFFRIVDGDDGDDDGLHVLRYPRQYPVTRQESGARSIRATRKL